MEEQNKFEEVTESVKEYINIQYELLVLKGTEKASNIFSGAISGILITIAGILTLLFLSLGVAFYLSYNFFNDFYPGFLIVGGAYLVVVLLLIGFRKSLLTKPFRNIIIKAMFNND